LYSLGHRICGKTPQPMALRFAEKQVDGVEEAMSNMMLKEYDPTDGPLVGEVVEALLNGILRKEFLQIAVECMVSDVWHQCIIHRIYHNKPLQPAKPRRNPGVKRKVRTKNFQGNEERKEAEVETVSEFLGDGNEDIDDDSDKKYLLALHRMQTSESKDSIFDYTGDEYKGNFESFSLADNDDVDAKNTGCKRTQGGSSHSSSRPTTSSLTNIDENETMKTKPNDQASNGMIEQTETEDQPATKVSTEFGKKLPPSKTVSFEIEETISSIPKDRYLNTNESVVKKDSGEITDLLKELHIQKPPVSTTSNTPAKLNEEKNIINHQQDISQTSQDILKPSTAATTSTSQGSNISSITFSADNSVRDGNTSNSKRRELEEGKLGNPSNIDVEENNVLTRSSRPPTAMTNESLRSNMDIISDNLDRPPTSITLGSLKEYEQIVPGRREDLIDSGRPSTSLSLSSENIHIFNNLNETKETREKKQQREGDTKDELQATESNLPMQNPIRSNSLIGQTLASAREAITRSNSQEEREIGLASSSSLKDRKDSRDRKKDET